MNLRQINSKDQIELKKVYFDSIQSIDENIYDEEQKRAWSSQAWENPNFTNSINNGNGWLISENQRIIAFACRYPSNRVSLFYCRGEFQRKGNGSRLLNKLEEDAKREKQSFLTTEASLISYKLFLKENWEIVCKEKIIIKNKYFERYKMIKNLN